MKIGPLRMTGRVTRSEALSRQPPWQEALDHLREFVSARSTPAGVALAAMLIVVGVLSPDSRTYSGATLLLSSLVPLALAALAQLFVIALGDIDLGIGKFVGLVNAVAVTILVKNTFLGALALVGGVVLYILMGLLIHLRRAPAIVITLGASFVWLGLALVLLPSPGGTAPSYLMAAVSFNVPLVPYPIVLFAGMIVVAALVLRRSLLGSTILGLGSSKRGARRSGIKVWRGVAVAYGLAGVCAVLAGLAITGVATSGDVSVGSGYTLNTIAAVILGGGQFSGGRVSGMGTVLGAIVVGLVGAVLSLVGISSSYDFGVEGLLLLVFVSLRWILSRRQVALT